MDELDPVVAKAFERACKALSAKGVKVEQIDLPQLNELPAINAKGGFAASEAYAWHQKLIARRGKDYDPLVYPRIMRGKEMSAADYIDLLAARADLQKRVVAVTSNYDAVVMPTCAIVAPTLDEVSTPEGFTRKNMLLLRNTTVGNFLDRCGISLPCHAAGELPVGFMLMGEAMADKRVLAMARSVAPVVQRLTDRRLHEPASGGLPSPPWFSVTLEAGMSSHRSPSEVRASLKHPIIDADGHWVEYNPVFAERMRKLAGDKAADGFLASQRRIPDALKLSIAERKQRGIAMEGYWTRQTTNTRDRATAMMPRLLYDRLDELGIDFGIIYPTAGLERAAHPGRRDAAGRVPGLQPRHRRLLRQARRSPDAGRGHPDVHARGGDRGARVLRQAARRQGRHVRQRRPPHGQGQGRRSRPRPPHRDLRAVRHRQRPRLRPGLAEVPRARRRADLPCRRPRLRPAQLAQQLHLQPYRPLRRRRPRRSPRACSWAA